MVQTTLTRQNQKQFWVLFAGCSLVFLALRLVYLEWDLPSLALSAYFLGDELFYAVGGFNLFQYGVPDYQHLPYLKTDTTIMFCPPLNDWLTYLGLSVFGNNFYAIRVPAVAAGFLVFLISFILIKTPKEGENPKIQAIFIALIFLSFNFSFVMASRVFEPTIIRMASMMLCLWAAIKLSKGDQGLSANRSIILGIAAGSAFCLVYLTNIFVPAAMVFGIFLCSLKHGFFSACRQAFYALAGILISLALFTIYHELMYSQPLTQVIPEFFNVYSKLNAVGNEAKGSILGQIGLNAFKTLWTNIFRFNSALYFLFIISLPLFLLLTLRRRTTLDLYLFSFWFLFSLQSCFVNDFAARKMVMLLPFVILIVFRVWLYRNEIREQVRDNKKLRIAFLVYCSLVLLQSISHIFNSTMVTAWSYVELDQQRVETIRNFSAFNMIIAGSVFFCWYKGKQKAATIATYLLTFTMLLPELWLDHRYIFKNPGFKHRDAMIELADTIDGKQVAGCISMAMRLYNNANIFLNVYRYNPSTTYEAQLHEGKYGETIKRLVTEGKIDYTFCRLNEIRFDMKAMNFELLKVFPIDADPARAVGLYRPIPSK